MMTSPSPMLPQVARHRPVGVRWFSGGGCVIERGDECEVTVGGLLVGRFRRGEVGARNAILVGLAEDPKIHLGELARAFGLSEEMVRLIRRRFERGGLPAVITAKRGGTRGKVDEGLRVQLEEMFAAGATVSQAHARVSRRRRISRATIGLARKAWAARRAAKQAPATAAPGPQTTSAMLPGLATSTPAIDAAPVAAPTVVAAPTPEETSAAMATSAGMVAPSATLVPTVAPTRSGVEASSRGEVRGGDFVQHAGTWLLLSALDRYGLYELASSIALQHGLDNDRLRVAIDAMVTALAIGEGTVEGVRRLATPSAPTLLRASHTPSPDWVRGTLGRLAEVGVTPFHLGMTGRYLAAAQADDAPAVFYVDNHLRPYTGKRVLRKGWRMQDKRVRPGTTDYYVHDEDGRPVLRMVSSTHETLTEWLLPIADLLRAGLGDDQRILLAFDRAGAYPEVLAALREESFEFVTYERRPYRELPASAFERELVVERGRREVPLRFAEFRVALGRGRGDVRRIALRTEAERQVNLLAISSCSAERLIGVCLGRWVQENGLKHGVERWGTNQLDGRRTAPYAPDTVIPNPARRRLIHALRLACVREGLARNQLSRLPDDEAGRAALLEEIASAIREQEELVARRAQTPSHAPLAETELAGKLVYHRFEYKAVLDTIRIACANAESDLAEMLAPELPRAAEVKKTLANLFKAPGHVRTESRTIRVNLAPAGTGPEQAAYAALFAKLDTLNLHLPGDPRRRLLRFRSQIP